METLQPKLDNHSVNIQACLQTCRNTNICLKGDDREPYQNKKQASVMLIVK